MKALPTSPLVSVVLPTYKRADLLPHAIRSVLAQTHANLELVVVDDNSPDTTPEVVRSFADPRVRYVRNPENLKLPRGLNKGFSLTRGDYLTWTSDDNLYAPDAIERMVEVLAAGEGDFVFADYFHFSDIDASGRPMDVQRVQLPATPRLELGNSLGACFLYTRKVYERVGQYDPELFLVEDYDYWIRIGKQFRIAHIPEPLYYFRRHDDALFCSRYAEVKAADVLVRYKNGLLTEDGAAAACAELIMRDVEGLRNQLLGAAYRVARKASYRLTKAYERLLEAYVRRRLEAPVRSVLRGFRAQALTFAEARDALREALQHVARVEYRS